MDQNLNNINQIDMTFSGYEEESDSFDVITENVGTSVTPVKTGIIINFEDEEDIDINIKKHLSNKSVDIPKKDYDLIFSEEKNQVYNKIDMECKYGDDTEDEYINPVVVKKPLLFDEEETTDLEDKELVLGQEIIHTTPSEKTTSASLEDDFWKQLSKKALEQQDDKLVEVKTKKEQTGSLQNQLRDLQKKHAKSNKKGAMGSAFRFIGNIEKEHSFFDSAMGNSKGTSSIINTAPTGDGGLVLGRGGGTEAIGGGDAGGGMSENLAAKNYTETLKEVFDAIGFEVINDRNGELIAKDLYNDSNTVKAKNIPDLIYALHPFIETCIIIPLSIYTKQNFKSYKDWSDWYTNENKAKYPKYNNEIKYCDLLANHLHECEI